MKHNYSGFVASVGLVALLYGASPALAQTAPSLGTAASFAVLGSSTVTNTGASVITGDLGVGPGTAVTGFLPGIVTGMTHAGNATAAQAQSDITTAYNNLTGQACTSDLTGQDLGGKTLTPGVYCFSAAAGLTGTLTLNGQGNANAVFIFKTGSTLTTASNSMVVVSNGTQNSNVFWQIGSSATLGTGTTLVGTLIALASNTLTTGARVFGRVLARNGAVTLDSNTVVRPSSAPPGPPPIITLNYEVTIPVVKVMPNPCTSGGFVLLNGTTTIAIKTIQSADFKFEVAFTSAGRGEDVLANGTPVSNGTQGLPYEYSSQTGGDATFPDGKPEDFMQTVNVTEFLTRAPGQSTPDEFLMNAIFELTFTNGLPLLPVLRAIDVSCGDK